MMSKANNGQGNIPERDGWITPEFLWTRLNYRYSFDFDCCANKNNTKTKKFSSDFKSVKKISGCAWMNPPFSKAKEMFEHFFKVVEEGVAIYRCDNLETGIWQQVILPNASWIFIPNHRICYEGMSGQGSRFPSALIGFRVTKPSMPGFYIQLR